MKKLSLFFTLALFAFHAMAQINLPLDFEQAPSNYVFTDFAGGNVTVVPNSQLTGINTSAQVAKMIKFSGQTYGGSFIALSSPIDFSTNKTFKMKVFAPRSGVRILLKVENNSNPGIFFEREVSTSVANAWEEISFNFSAISTTNQYQKMVLIFDNGTMGDGSDNFTFLFDDIMLTSSGGGPVLSQMDLPVTFDATTVEYGLIGFGGAEQSSIVTDPTLSTNKVAKVIKTATAELWAGTTITAAAGLGFANAIPFDAQNTKMSVRVWSPDAGIPVRLKAEEHGDPTHSVETEATVTTASGWQTLEFDFTNHASGTTALNLAYNYDKVSIFFNFGTTGAVAGEKTYYFDDVQFANGGGGGGGSTNPVLPLTFESTTINYTFNDFDGGTASVVSNPQSGGINTSPKVGKMVKNMGQTWGGSWLMLDGNIDFSVNKIFKMKVYAPRVGTKVLLKVENENDGSINFEREVLTTVANAWEELTFNFTAINTANQYKKVVFIFDNGTMGDGSANFTYYFDDLLLTTGGGGGPVLSQMDLPVTFDAATVEYGLIGFGGAEQSTIVTDPTLSSNKVAKVIKTATAELWAGTTITAAAGLGFANSIPFDAQNTKMSVRVWSPDAGIPVRLKAEEHGDPTHSVETEATVTTASGWQTLEFDFANHATGTTALNLAYNYDKVSIFFNFGTTGAVAGEKTYYFDDVQFVNGGGGPVLTQMDLPVSFDATTVEYGLIGFGGAEQSSIVTDPTLSTNKVAKVIKTATAELWAGTTITAAAGLGFANAIPFDAQNTKMSVRVWSPDAGIPVRLKAEEHGDPTHSVETEATVTTASGWQTLEFDFANHATGTTALNLAYNYDKVSIFFNFGTTGAVAGEKTYYFDDVQFVNGGGGGSTNPVLPLTFESTTINYTFNDFDGGTSTVVSNPQSGGINTSPKVGKMVKNMGQTWGGSWLMMDGNIDFSVNKIFKMKVYAPRVGAKVLMKVENETDGAISYEREVLTTVANAWEELTFNFTAINTANQYKKVVFIFDNGTMGDGSANFTYYFDDLLLTTGGGGGPVLSQLDLPVTFDAATVEYGLIGFGGAEQSTIVTDPTLSSNKVAKVIKTATAELWAGTTITAAAGLGFANSIPFDAQNTKLSVRVWSPDAGIPVRLKLENHSDPTQSVETESTVTIAAGWQVIEFDFVRQAEGTQALNFSYQYDKAIIFFNFGTSGAQVGEKTYYFDDVAFIGGGGINPLPSLPLDFESTTLTYNFVDFDGGSTTTLANPYINTFNASPTVAKMVKNAGQTWGGSLLQLNEPIDFSLNKLIRMKVYAPRIGTKVLLKVENSSNPAVNFEKEVTTTLENVWEDLTFDFSSIDPAISYHKLVFIFDNGTMGDGSTDYTYYFDDIRQEADGNSNGNLVQMNLPLTFEDATVDYGLIGFDGAELSTIVNDPTRPDNKVAKVIKSASASATAGTAVTAAEQLGFATSIPFDVINTKLSLRVWAGNAGVKVRLRLEEHDNALHAVETEVKTTGANRWQTLVFDFAKEVQGTSPLNFNYHYDKAIIYFNYGVDGATAGQKTYYFDDMLFLTSSAQIDQDEFMDLIKPYPNPTINNIHLNNPAGMPLLVKIIDESGRNLKVITSTNADVEIPMEKYAAGCYTLFIQNKINNRIVTRRIIKQ